MKLKGHFVALTCLGLIAGGASLGHIAGLSLVTIAYAKGGGHGSGGNGESGHGQSSSDHGKSADAHGKSVSHETIASVSENESDVSAFGALNAAHASATARKHASPNSAVGKIATYEKSREAALTLQDPAAQEQALNDAKTELAQAFGKTELTAAQIDKINALLDARQ